MPLFQPMKPMVCNNCNKETDYLERINPTGQTGIFYCEGCLAEREAAIQELRAMRSDQLQNVPFELVKWICAAKGCNRHTKLRDYGIAPFYWWTNKKKWMPTHTNFYLCSKHWKIYSHLLKKGFENWHIQRKILKAIKNLIE